MSKQKAGLVPELRFPEFLTKGEWDFKTLDKCLDYLQPTKYLVNSSSYDCRFKTPVLTAGKTFILGYSNEDKGIFNENLPVIIFDDFTTSSKFVDFPFKVKSSAIKILLAKKDIDIRFCYESIQLINYQTGVHKRHWISIFSKIYISMPEFREQQKIADCLSSIDELITANTQKLNALKAHKKGLLQQLFPADGETLPKLRFPEFRDRGRWESKELGEFIFERNQIQQEKVSLYSLTIEDGIVPKTDRYERSFLVKNEADAYKLVKQFDFVYNPMNLRFGAIAMYSGFEDVAVSQYYNIFYCNDMVDSKFYEIYLKSPRMIIHYDNVATGSLIEKRRVHFSDFLKFVVPFPSLNEQKKIAYTINSIQKMIDAQFKKLNKLKEHKKSLMQRLFPVIDKVI